ncbi:hypothetical protein [Acetobacterium malicum]|uniref:hypothetical protein n=1 Tax=Acetobacterium malicum TaxID=52692 RepID=UPI0035936733
MDELVAFAGLDQADLNNYYLVANYIACLEKRRVEPGVHIGCVIKVAQVGQ